MGQSPCYIVIVSRGLSIKTQRCLVLTYPRHLVVGDRRTRKCWSEENCCSHKNFNLYHRFKNLKVSWITVEPLTGKKNMISLVNRDSQIIFSTNHDKVGESWRDHDLNPFLSRRTAFVNAQIGMKKFKDFSDRLFFKELIVQIWGKLGCCCQGQIYAVLRLIWNICRWPEFSELRKSSVSHTWHNVDSESKQCNSLT